MKKGIKILIVVALLLVLGGVGFYGYTQFKNKDSGGSNPKKPKVVKEIKDYDYKLVNESNKRYKELFNILLKELSKTNKEEIDEELYAKTVAEMFAIDFYDLSSKKSKNDIGGVQFIHTRAQNNFILEASDTMYKYIEHNLDGKRTQKLPHVDSVTVGEVTKTAFTYNKVKDANAYSVKLTINYTEDLGYPKNITVILYHEDKIIKEKTEEQEEEKITKLSIVSVK